MKHYLSIYKENFPDGDLKSESFASKRGNVIIQRTAQTHNSHNWFDLSGCFYFEIPQKKF